MRSTWKRALSTILTVCMIASLLVVPASATSSTVGNVTTYTLDIGTGKDITENVSTRTSMVDGYFSVMTNGYQAKPSGVTFSSGTVGDGSVKIAQQKTSSDPSDSQKKIHFTTKYANAQVTVWWYTASAKRTLAAVNGSNTSYLGSETTSPEIGTSGSTTNTGYVTTFTIPNAKSVCWLGGVDGDIYFCKVEVVETKPSVAGKTNDPSFATDDGDVFTMGEGETTTASATFTLSVAPAAETTYKLYAAQDATNALATATVSEGTTLSFTNIEPAIAAGTYYVTATAGTDAESEKVAVTVQTARNPAADITMDTTAIELAPKGTQVLSIAVVATDTNEECTDVLDVKSSNENVAVWAGGTVTAKEIGAADITATAGEVSKKVKVSVVGSNQEGPVYTLDVGQMGAGTLPTGAVKYDNYFTINATGTSAVSKNTQTIAGTELTGRLNPTTDGAITFTTTAEKSTVKVWFVQNGERDFKLDNTTASSVLGADKPAASAGAMVTFTDVAKGDHTIAMVGGTEYIYQVEVDETTAVEEPSVADKAASDLATAIGGEGEAPALDAISFDDTLDAAVSTDKNDLKANSTYLTGIVKAALETKLGAERTVNVNVLTATYTEPVSRTPVDAGSIAYTAELVNKTDSNDKANIGGTISLLAEPAVEPDTNVTGAVTKAPVGLGDQSDTLAPGYKVEGTKDEANKTTAVTITADKLVKHESSDSGQPGLKFWLGFGMENTAKKDYVWKYSKDGTAYSEVSSVATRYVTVEDKNYNTVYVEVDKDLNTADNTFIMQQCTEDGSTVLWTYKVTVTVGTLVQDYDITKAEVTEGGNFTYAVDGIEGNDPGKAQNGATVTVTPAADATYELDKITVTKTGDAETTVAVDADAHTFTMPEYPVTITVTFKGVPTVTAVAIKKDGTEITTDTIQYAKDATVTYTADVTGSHLTTADDKAVTWASSNESVATVADGTVTILKAGTTSITATSTKATDKVGTVALTVSKAAAPTLTVTANPEHIGPAGGDTVITIAGVPAGSAVAPTVACDGATNIGTVTKSGDNYTATVTLPKNEGSTEVTYAVKVNWAGDDNYEVAAETTHDVVVNVAGAIILNVHKDDAQTAATATSGGELKFVVTAEAKVHESDGSETAIQAENITYKWSVKDGADIEGATAATYTISPATVADNNGKTYVCTVTATYTPEGGEAKTKTTTEEFTATVTKKAGTAPTASFDAATMKLTGLTAGQQYSVDGGTTWTAVESGTEATLENVTAENGIKVKAPADAETEEAVQIITVTKAETPALTAGDQQITITNFVETATYQIKSGVEAYADATVTAGVISGLINDTEYTVRVKAAGTMLASDEAKATPVAAAPETRTLTFAVDTGATVTDVTVGGTAATLSGNTLEVAKDAVVTFKVNVTDDTKELDAVKLGGTAIEATEGVYTVAAGEADATVTVTLKDKAVTPPTPGAAYKMGYAVLPEDTLTTTAETEIPTGVVGVKLSAGANSTYTMHFDITSGDYVGYLQGSANPKGAGATDVPTEGSYYKFAVEKDGKLVIDYVIAGNGKTAYVVKKPASGANTNVVTVTGSKEAKQVVINDAVAGDTYYVVISGSKVGLMGFTFEAELTDAEKPDYKLDEGKTAAAGATYDTTLADTPDAAAAEKLAKKTAAAAVNNHNVTVSIVDGAWADPAVGGNGTYKFKVKLTTANGEAVTTDEITMTIVAGKLVTGITVTAAEGATEVMEDKTLQLSAAVTPDDADNKAVEWSSSDEGVATVSETGLVTGVAPGTVKITATAADGSNVKGEIDLTVTDDPTTEKFIFLNTDFEVPTTDHKALTAADFTAAYPDGSFKMSTGAKIEKRTNEAVEIAKEQADKGIEFVVPAGTKATVTMELSSSGGGKTSDAIVKNAAGTAVAEDSGAVSVTNSTPHTELKWTDLPAGTYTLCTAGSSTSALRVYKIVIKAVSDTPVVEKVTVTYEAKDAEGNPVTVTLPAGGEVDKGTAISLNDLTVPGYTFDGWFVGETKVTAATYTVNEDTTFTAKFTKSTVTPGVDKTALTAAIAAATEAAEAVVVDTDAANVDEGKKWVTAAEKKAYTDAIAAADAIAKKADATEAEVTKAVEDLATATTAFEAAKKDGAKKPVVELKDIVAVARNGKAVYDGQPHGLDSVTVTEPAEGATITYAASETGEFGATPITRTDAGTTDVYVKITADGYKDKVLHAQITVSKAPVELTLTADKDNIHSATEADREVTFTVAPAGTEVTITCDVAGVTVTDGKVTLPDETKEYTFTATFAGDANHEAAEAKCVVNVTHSDEVNKVALDRAIKAAEAVLAETETSADGTDVTTDKKWATETDKKTLQDAIDAAKGLAADADQAAVDAAVTALTGATTTFDGKRQDGTKPVELNKADLEKAITDAETALKAAKDSETGDDVYTNETWISAADKHDLQDAIDAAKALLEDATATQEQIDAAKDAIDAAKAEIKKGNKSTGGGGYRPSGSSSSAGTGTKTETLPDGTKRVTETKRDGSVVVTQTKPDGTKVVTTTDKDGNVTGTVTVPASVDKTTVSVPVDDANTGMVPVIVKADGTEEIIRNSSVEDGEVIFPMEETGTIKIVNNAKHFVDLDGHWAEDEANYVSARELFNGVDATHFAPDATMTRGMMATVLFRLDGESKSDKAGDFSDVKVGDWFADAVDWAAEAGVINGYTDGSFAPNKSITREELVVMVYRYAGTPDSEAADMTDFTDADQVAEWAEAAMNWAIKSGIINGKGNGVLDPKGNATRAEVSAVLERFVKLANQ